jgi:hypothetical protein
VEQSAAKRRDEGWQVNVAADQSGSKPDASERSEKCGYHPLEELSKLEKEEMLAANGRPTAAAIARTVAEVPSCCPCHIDCCELCRCPMLSYI